MNLYLLNGLNCLKAESISWKGLGRKKMKARIKTSASLPSAASRSLTTLSLTSKADGMLDKRQSSQVSQILERLFRIVPRDCIPNHQLRVQEVDKTAVSGWKRLELQLNREIV